MRKSAFALALAFVATLGMIVPSVSAAAGDPLSAGSFRYYFVYYRDPVVLGGCPATAGFNATDTLQVVWGP